MPTVFLITFEAVTLMVPLAYKLDKLMALPTASMENNKLLLTVIEAVLLAVTAADPEDAVNDKTALDAAPATA